MDEQTKARLKDMRLTPEEARILKFAAQGLSNTQIGERVGRHGSTIKSHLGRIYAKLDVHGRAEAVDKAYALGYLDDSANEAKTRLRANTNVAEELRRARNELRTRARRVVPEDGSTPVELLQFFGMARRRVLTEPQYRWLRTAWDVLLEAAEVSWEAKGRQ